MDTNKALSDLKHHPVFSSENYENRRLKAARTIFLLLVALGFLSPLLINLHIHPLVVFSVCLTIIGYAADAYLEISRAIKSESNGDDSIQKTGLALLLEIIKKSPWHAMPNYFAALCILALAYITLKNADVPEEVTYSLVVLVFLCALGSILLIWLIRRIRP